MVVFQRIEVEASGRVVAEHVDPTDLDQTVYFPAMASVLRMPSPPPAPIRRRCTSVNHVVDVVDYAGLAVGERYRMELTLHERRPDGTCTPHRRATPSASSGVEFVTTGVGRTRAGRSGHDPGAG